MMNSRNQTGKHRFVSLSSDGGATWDTTFVDYNLPDPICEGSLYRKDLKKNITAGYNILFIICGCAYILAWLIIHLLTKNMKPIKLRFPISKSMSKQPDN